MNPRSILTVFALVSATCIPVHARRQEWREGFGAPGVALNLPARAEVHAQLNFDDGSGPALYVGGDFTAAGEIGAAGLARWRASGWETLGDAAGHASFETGVVRVLHAHDSGAGPELYAGGDFSALGGVGATNIARWDGASWSPLAQGLRRAPAAMAAFDDGSGLKLFVACPFSTQATSGFTSNLAAWDGATWTDVSFAQSSSIASLTVYDDGAGPALFAGGRDFLLNGAPVAPLLKRVGSLWSTTGITSVILVLTTTGSVSELEVFDDGAGEQLYLGGDFTSVNGVASRAVARWDGVNVSAFDAGLQSGAIQDLHVFDDGGGAALYAAGALSLAGGVNTGVARWQAGSWVDIGSGHYQSFCLEDFDDGAGPALFAGGNFIESHAARADRIARWRAGAWSSLSDQKGVNSEAFAFAAFDTGAGPELYVAGSFTWAGPAYVPAFAKWNGSVWSAASALVEPTRLLAFDDGAGERLYALGGGAQVTGGSAQGRVSSWDGVQWTTLGLGPTGTSGGFLDMATYDEGVGEKLWVAGSFTSVSGVPAKRVARWDGAAWWSPAIGPNNTVRALAVHDDGQGGGSQLYVGGEFLKVGTVNYFGIARWNGANWSQVGAGFSGNVLDLAVHDDGQGAKLYAAGTFLSAPPNTVRSIACWDGFAWQPLDGGLLDGGAIYALESFDDGNGPALYAGGEFPSIGGVAARNLARWTNSWSPAGQPDDRVSTLSVLTAVGDVHPSLYIGGRFTVIDASAHPFFAVLERADPCQPVSYCTAGVSTNGCAGTMSASGAPSASLATPFTVTASGVEGQKLGLLFYGVSGRSSAPWGATSSVLCVKAPTQRTGTLNSGGAAAACDGVLTLDWNAYQSAHPSALGQPFQAGDTVNLQGWYRDPPSAKTTALTDALEARICP